MISGLENSIKLKLKKLNLNEVNNIGNKNRYKVLRKA